MNDADSLYQDAIKQFAQAALGHGTLVNAAGEARLDNPLCGDRVRMQVALDAGLPCSRPTTGLAEEP